MSGPGAHSWLMLETRCWIWWSYPVRFLSFKHILGSKIGCMYDLIFMFLWLISELSVGELNSTKFFFHFCRESAHSGSPRENTDGREKEQVRGCCRLAWRSCNRLTRGEVSHAWLNSLQLELFLGYGSARGYHKHILASLPLQCPFSYYNIQLGKHGIGPPYIICLSMQAKVLLCVTFFPSWKCWGNSKGN